MNKQDKSFRLLSSVRNELQARRRHDLDILSHCECKSSIYASCASDRVVYDVRVANSRSGCLTNVTNEYGKKTAVTDAKQPLKKQAGPESRNH